MAKAWAINEDTGAPEYAAQELRRLSALHLHPGTTHRFGARQGVRPHSSAAVSVAGSTWTVHDLCAVVYPGLTSLSGPYVVELEEESGSVDPADGSNPRLDALDLQIRDDDEDSAGERDVRVVYAVGTPASSPSAPAATSNSLRLATILVSAGGSPSPSVASLAPWTVATGGILPVRDDSELPVAGLHDGMAAWDIDTRSLVVRDDSAWQEVAGPVSVRRVGRSSTQSVPDNTDSTLGLNNSSEAFTVGPAPFNISGTQAVIQRDGVFRIDAGICWEGNSSGWRRVNIVHHPSGGAGTVIAQHTTSFSTSGISNSVAVSTVFRAEEGDEFSYQGRQTSSGSLNVLADPRTFLIIERIGSL